MTNIMFDFTPGNPDAMFADVYIALMSAEREYKRNPTKANKETWLELSREYSRQLRERQDAARGRQS